MTAALEIQSNGFSGVKERLLELIRGEMEDTRTPQAALAEALDVTQPRVSQLLRSLPEDVDIERLITILNALHYDVGVAVGEREADVGEVCAVAQIPIFERLRLPERVADEISQLPGLTVVAGSHRRTNRLLMYSILSYVNRGNDRNIWNLDTEISDVVGGMHQTTEQLCGNKSFAEAVRHLWLFMRGEILALKEPRDAESLEVICDTSNDVSIVTTLKAESVNGALERLKRLALEKQLPQAVLFEEFKQLIVIGGRDHFGIEVQCLFFDDDLREQVFGRGDLSTVQSRIEVHKSYANYH